MYTTLLLIHSTIRYIVLVLLLGSFFSNMGGFFGKKPFTNLQQKLGLFTLISTHTQLVIGLLLYFVSPLASFAHMKGNSEIRYWTVEHLSLMVFAIALITVGHIRAKKTEDDQRKHKLYVMYFGLSLIVIVLAIIQSGRSLI